MIVYKVVYPNRDGEFLSAIIGSFYGNKYAIGVKTTRNKTDEVVSFGPLAAFRTKGQALSFGDSGHLAIFEAEAEESKDNHLWYETPMGSEVKISNFPDGTIFCDSITLLERID